MIYAGTNFICHRIKQLFAMVCNAERSSDTGFFVTVVENCRMGHTLCVAFIYVVFVFLRSDTHTFLKNYFVCDRMHTSR